MKAVAVCPDGNELWRLLSGRRRLTLYLMELTKVATDAVENADETIILPHELRLSQPNALSPIISAAGEYWR